MKRHLQQAQQLYGTLKRKGQTWSRNAATLAEWAEQFERLESTIGSRKRIQRLLDWYTTKGCGALYVPLLGNGESFRQKFEQLDQARIRLKNQTLRYFDDVLDYNIIERPTGSRAQKECNRVMQRVQQQIQFIDDLAHGRAKLPPPKAALRNGHSSNGHTTNGKATKPLTKAERELASNYLLISREAVWQLLMQNPANQEEFTDRLRNHSPKLNRWFKHINEDIDASQN
jgi:hypothetical protein